MIKHKVKFCYFPVRLMQRNTAANESGFDQIGWVWWQKAYLVNNLNYGFIAFLEDQTEDKMNKNVCRNCGHVVLR